MSEEQNQGQGTPDEGQNNTSQGAPQNTAASANYTQTAGTSTQPTVTLAPNTLTFSQKDFAKKQGEAREEARRAKEREISEALGVSIDDAKEIISTHQQRQEAEQSEAQKAQARVSKLETKVADLSGYKERYEQMEQVVRTLLEREREGLNPDILELLEGKNPVEQLDWLATKGAKYKAASQEAANGNAMVNTPRIAPDASSQRQAPKSDSQDPTVVFSDRLKAIFNNGGL